MNIVSALNYAEYNKGCVYLPFWNGHRNGSLQYVYYDKDHFRMRFNDENYMWMPSWLDIRSNEWDVITSDEVKAYGKYSDIVTEKPDNLEELFDDEPVTLEAEHLDEAAKQLSEKIENAPTV